MALLVKVFTKVARFGSLTQFLHGALNDFVVVGGAINSHGFSSIVRSLRIMCSLGLSTSAIAFCVVGTLWTVVVRSLLALVLMMASCNISSCRSQVN